jgi:MYXO-CTERM domain-containing protein
MTTIRLAALAAAGVLAAAPAWADGLVLDDQTLVAYSDLQFYQDGFSNELVGTDARHTGVAATSVEADSLLNGLPIGHVAAVQSEGGLSALSVGFLDDKAGPGQPSWLQSFGQVEEAFTSYQMTVQNTSATPQPLALNFFIFPGELQIGTPSKDTGQSDISVGFTISGIEGPTPPDGYGSVQRYDFSAQLGVNNATLTSFHTPYDSYPGLGVPIVTVGNSADSIPGVATLAWDEFGGTFQFTDLPPGYYFQLLYNIDIYVADMSSTPGVSIFGSAGDPAELKSGKGAGSSFQLVSGGQVFPVVPTGAPEPEVWALMLAGFAGLGAMSRRRRAQAGA